MWIAPCSCATGTKRMPAAGKISSASMNADPTMPKTWVTPWVARVSTNASEGPIFCDALMGRLRPVSFCKRDVLSLDRGYLTIGGRESKLNSATCAFPYHSPECVAGCHEYACPHAGTGRARDCGRNLLDAQGRRGARGPRAGRAPGDALGAHAGNGAAQAAASPHARALRRGGVSRPRAGGPRLHHRRAPVAFRS